jgi:hypothetical protein
VHEPGSFQLILNSFPVNCPIFFTNGHLPVWQAIAEHAKMRGKNVENYAGKASLNLG